MKQKVNLIELAAPAESLKIARSLPIHKESRNIDFIKNFVLGIPTQVMIDSPMPEKMPENNDADLEEIKKLSGS